MAREFTTEQMDRAGVYAPNKQSGWLKCPICRNEFYWTEKCFETNDGDLCEQCTAEMRAEQEQESKYQEQGES